MKKYKVEYVQTETFIVDVEALDEQEATDKATKRFYDLQALGTLHYHNTGNNGTDVGTVYDVTNTDDPFNP